MEKLIFTPMQVSTNINKTQSFFAHAKIQWILWMGVYICSIRVCHTAPFIEKSQFVELQLANPVCVINYLTHGPLSMLFYG